MNATTFWQRRSTCFHQSDLWDFFGTNLRRKGRLGSTEDASSDPLLSPWINDAVSRQYESPRVCKSEGQNEWYVVERECRSSSTTMLKHITILHRTRRFALLPPLPLLFSVLSIGSDLHLVALFTIVLVSSTLGRYGSSLLWSNI